MDRNGSLPLTLLLFSRPDDPGCESIKSRSSSETCFLLPHTLQTTTAIPPSKIAPPMPTTVPMMILRSEGLRPELPESASFPSSFGAPLDVDAETGTGNTLVDLTVLVTEVPPVTYTTMLVTTWVVLLVGLVEDGGAGPVVVEGPCKEEITPVVLWIAAVDAGSDSAFGLSLAVEVDEGSSSSGGDMDVDTELGLLDVAREDSGVSLGSIEEIILLEASEDAEIDEAGVGLAEAPVPLGTICRYRSA